MSACRSQKKHSMPWKYSLWQFQAAALLRTRKNECSDRDDKPLDGLAAFSQGENREGHEMLRPGWSNAQHCDRFGAQLQTGGHERMGVLRPGFEPGVPAFFNRFPHP